MSFIDLLARQSNRAQLTAFSTCAVFLAWCAEWTMWPWWLTSGSEESSSSYSCPAGKEDTKPTIWVKQPMCGFKLLREAPQPVVSSWLTPSEDEKCLQLFKIIMMFLKSLVTVPLLSFELLPPSITSQLSCWQCNIAGPNSGQPSLDGCSNTSQIPQIKAPTPTFLLMSNSNRALHRHVHVVGERHNFHS